MRKIVSLFFLLFVISFRAAAVEGMWIPSLIDMFHSDMQTYGLKLSPEEIYATNQASLKDAIVQFDGGCTAEIVSEEGLLLTNHHCGFGAIQSHSSLEHDYLKDGFWAKNQQEEIACPWMYVTFVREIRDVTSQILPKNGSANAGKISEKISELEKEFSKGNLKAKIKPFNKGNQYFMLITEDFNDIRLVGAPPSAIGKFGGDTDNWVWPRHTGDFSVFRIYANKSNASAQYSEENVPYKPKKSLKISLKPKQVGDFTMVYGFPGRTDQHYSSGKLAFYIDQERPARIDMRQHSLDIIKPAMNASDGIRIKYASKQAGIANAWKKWIGQIGGLRELRSIEKKKAFEEEYRARAAEKTEWKDKYYGVIKEMNNLQKKNEKYEMARAMLVEYYFYGPEFLNFSFKLRQLMAEYQAETTEEGKTGIQEEMIANHRKFFKNYDKSTDQGIFNALTPLYIDYVDDALLPEGMESNWQKKGNTIFKKSVILNEEKLLGLLENFGKKSIKKIGKDPAFTYASMIYDTYIMKAAREYSEFHKKEEALMQTYVEGIMTMFPDKNVWADANSTMRIAYGKLEGSSPKDGLIYEPYTTIDGIMQKYDPNNPDFQLTSRFLQLYKEGDYGDYAQDGELWVCFTASNHTTGGNSGSPVLDAEGHLMGINFDRSWESTMSDFMFDESRCRNIIVDIRYVLWVIDKYGEAGHLIEEMTFVK